MVIYDNMNMTSLYQIQFYREYNETVIITITTLFGITLRHPIRNIVFGLGQCAGYGTQQVCDGKLISRTTFPHDDASSQYQTLHFSAINNVLRCLV